MCFSAIAVANTILDMAAKRNINDITPMKLQKLVFLAHALYYKQTQAPLIMDPIGVWRYGPVIQDVYREFRGFGSSPITEYASNASGTIDIVPQSRKDVQTHLNQVLDIFGSIDGWRLSELTHLKDTAWSIARSEGRSYISDLDIQKGKIYRG